MKVIGLKFTTGSIAIYRLKHVKYFHFPAMNPVQFVRIKVCKTCGVDRIGYLLT